ncbi:hypothetical protein [Rubrivirga sp.]|uniref:hypothetical protein n=1 Tax=Rubrivirga sp. TaxID=1885344 RepID=UPI003B526FA6
MFALIAAFLLSLASFVFALLTYVDSRRLRELAHRSTALSSTHTASLLLGEAAGVIADVDRLLARSAIDPDLRARVDEIRQRVEADREHVARSMSEVAYGDLSAAGYREIAAHSSLTIYRVVGGRRELLDILLAVRADLPAEPRPAA